jgi:hypothetical protein
MATIVSTAPPFTMSNHVARRDSDSGEESPSTFTPVNGRGEQPHTNGINGDSSPEDISPNGEPYTGPSSADNSPSNSPRLHQKNGQIAMKGEHGTHDHISPPPQESVEQAHKRKRSSSTEANGYSVHARYDFSPPKRAEHQHMAEGALQALGDTDRHTLPQHPHQTNGGHHANHSHSNSWQSTPSQYIQQQSGGGPMNLSEARLATALQQANQQESGSPHNQQAVHETSSSHDGYGQDQNGSSQSGNKRKRQFANRTKTGCKTCRRRKKKCDEAQPACKFSGLNTALPLC